ncbi:TetR/AcrR family transcriptional regulator [Alteriqipengyuania sp.]|uniref:TetR/AcrR family transcriptional regulator n=1 Tax=Alteriqipengyuania sp. TaxID=2800692 RepID=UPI0035147295
MPGQVNKVRTTRARPNRNEEGRLEILAAATDAFMRLGYARASIDEIADQMGATKGRVYHYYRSKADILMDIHRHVLDMMYSAAVAESQAAEDPADAIRRMVRRHALIVMENLAFTRVALLSTTDLFVNEKQQDFMAEISKVRRDYESLFIDNLRKGMDQGLFREADPKLLAKPLLGSLNWTTMWYLDRPSATDESRAEIAELIVDYVMGGVLSR